MVRSEVTSLPASGLAAFPVRHGESLEDDFRGDSYPGGRRHVVHSHMLYRGNASNYIEPLVFTGQGPQIFI